jgi:hypothetical protein
MNEKTSHICVDVACFLVAPAIVLLAVFAITPHIAEWYSARSRRHETPAPGFCLATNSLGEWSCAYSNSDFVLRPSGFGRNGRQAAIDETWKQYVRDQKALAVWIQAE